MLDAPAFDDLACTSLGEMIDVAALDLSSCFLPPWDCMDRAPSLMNKNYCALQSKHWMESWVACHSELTGYDRGSLAYSFVRNHVRFIQLQYNPTLEEASIGINSSISWLRAELGIARTLRQQVVLNMHDVGDTALIVRAVTGFEDLVVAIFNGHLHEKAGYFGDVTDAIRGRGLLQRQRPSGGGVDGCTHQGLSVRDLGASAPGLRRHSRVAEARRLREVELSERNGPAHERELLAHHLAVVRARSSPRASATILMMKRDAHYAFDFGRAVRLRCRTKSGLTGP